MKRKSLSKRAFASVLAVLLLLPSFGCTEKAAESTSDPVTEKAPEQTVTSPETEKNPEAEQTTEDSCTIKPVRPVGTNKDGQTITAAKPVIYLYPECETSVSVRLDLDGKLTSTYPEYGTEGWQNITAYPDGRLDYNGREYYCLFWEGLTDKLPSISAGACVRGEDTVEYLETALAELGLTEREANEFIIYWLPQLEHNEYNLISFIGKEYTDTAKLDITPAPDSILRVYMLACPSEEYVQLPAQSFTRFEREGFCVVEWGGSLLK